MLGMQANLPIAARPTMTPGVAAGLGNVEFPVTVVLGQTRMRIQNLLKLGAGSLVELNRREGELAEIMVRQTLIARGEVVSVGGNYGLRIVEVVSREDRMALQPGPSGRTRRHPAERDSF
jgi:flagellar motor switch protein FliN/FliY